MDLEGSSGSLDFPGGIEGNHDKPVRVPGVLTKITPPEYEPRAPPLYASLLSITNFQYGTQALALQMNSVFTHQCICHCMKRH
jgi:hypothetical protein